MKNIIEGIKGCILLFLLILVCIFVIVFAYFYLLAHKIYNTVKQLLTKLGLLEITIEL